MKLSWIKRISIVLAALLLLVVLPTFAMAEVGTPSNAGEAVMTATPSNAGAADASGTEDAGAAEEIAAEPEEIAEVATPSNLVKEEKPAKNTEVQTAAAAALPQAAQAKAGAKELAGTWTVDGVTNYQFKADGSGALILPEHKYAFKYTVEEDVLKLAFENARIGKVAFAFAVDGDALTLSRETEAGTAEFALKKTK